MSDKEKIIELKFNLLSNVVHAALVELGQNQPSHVQARLDRLFDQWQAEEDKLEARLEVKGE